MLIRYKRCCQCKKPAIETETEKWHEIRDPAVFARLETTHQMELVENDGSYTCSVCQRRIAEEDTVVINFLNS